LAASNDNYDVTSDYLAGKRYHGETYYDLLGVSREATSDEIRTAYRKQAHIHHTDKSGSSNAAVMRLINQAYETLRDRARRDRYDKFLASESSEEEAQEEPDWDPPTPNPVVSFTVSVDFLKVTVDTSGTIPSSGVSFKCSWGDGSLSTSLAHRYAKPGTYTISVTATNSTGSSSATRTATVTAPPPPKPAVSLTVSADHLEARIDTSGTTPQLGVAFVYDWGDGSSSTSPSHSYTKPGTYTISVTATNSAGSSTASKLVTVTAPPPPKPVVAFTVSADYLNARVDTSETTPKSGVAFSYSWGDGSSKTQDPSHTYARPGNYTVSVTATNPAGSSTATRTVTVTAPPPMPAVSFTVSVDHLEARIDTSGTMPKSGVSFKCSWGDGSLSTSLAHTYAKAGTYTISVTATNSTGSSTGSRTITVTAPPPPFSFSVSGLKVTVDRWSTPEPAPTFSYSWGDGSSSRLRFHTYASPGTYTISITAPNDVDSWTWQQTVAVTVPTPPQIKPEPYPNLPAHLQRVVDERLDLVHKSLKLALDVTSVVPFGVGMSPGELAAVNKQVRTRLGIRDQAAVTQEGVFDWKFGHKVVDRTYTSSGMALGGREVGGRLALVEIWQRGNWRKLGKLERVVVLVAPDRAFVPNTDRSTKRKHPMVLSHEAMYGLETCWQAGSDVPSVSMELSWQQGANRVDETFLAVGIDTSPGARGWRPPEPGEPLPPGWQGPPPKGWHPPGAKPPSGPNEPRAPSGR
jgi:PKD repeat protein